jgi:membrane fusion protein (multidrug efflux system)
VKRLLIVLALLAPPLAAAGDAPSVLVRTEPLRQHTIKETLVGYGTLAPEVSGTVDINLPRPGRISALDVSPGQVVKRGARLLELRTSPGAALGYRQAENALAYARSELARAEQLVAQKLATESQLSAARKALADAEAALEAQRRLGTGTATESVKAPFDGVVVSVGAALGDRVAAGTAVLKLARLAGLRVLLGIEPSDSFAVRAGMPVRLTPVFDAVRTVDAHVAAVHGMVNPQTQLVDVVVRISSGDLLPGMRVKGEITLATRTGWAVPRSAVLRDGNGDYLYQVRDGVAHRVAITVESDGDRLLGISGSGLDPSLKVVAQGNYELHDGMAVREAAR